MSESRRPGGRRRRSDGSSSGGGVSFFSCAARGRGPRSDPRYDARRLVELLVAGLRAPH
ncbi:hypothetical protein [Streptomyces sp. NPDC014685]|uniref:hypothetical protein n=1 Tax=Streptomyces sp. NPDC014685 TaxID=3364881 RepID=UPI0036F7861E